MGKYRKDLRNKNTLTYTLFKQTCLVKPHVSSLVSAYSFGKPSIRLLLERIEKTSTFKKEERRSQKIMLKIDN